MKIQNNIKNHRGVASLAVILILLLSISGITLFSAQTTIVEQKVSSNDHRSRQIVEAADAGIDFALAWLSQYSPNWGTAVSGIQTDSNSIATTVGNYTVSVTLTRPTADPKKVSIAATATETGNTSAKKPTAVSRVSIVQKQAVGGTPQAPILVNGCMSGVTGSPEAHNNVSGGVEILTSQTDSPPGSCVDVGHLDDSDGTAPAVEDEGFTGTAWDNVFGITQSEMQALANIDPNVYWVTDTNPWNPPADPLGSVGSPVILIMQGCAKLNGNSTVYGIVYYPSSCGNNPGWGNVQIYGTVVFDGDITQLTANSEIEFDPSYVSNFKNTTFGVKNRVPGSWIDG